MIKQLRSALAVVMFALVFMLSSATNVFADYQPSGDPLSTLKMTIMSGTYTYAVGNKNMDYGTNRYKMKSGGYVYWNELFTLSVDYQSNYFKDNLGNLTEGEKRKFLEDVFRIANAVAADTEAGFRTGADAPTADTVTELYEIVQQESGMAGTLLASIMSNTKPDYATANRIYEPFSGIVGTILGLISVLIMAALGVTMGLDVAFITIPAFQMALGGETGDGNGKGDSKGMSRLISQEAHKAVKAAGDGSGGQAGDGDYKAAVGVYFKYRWKGLVLLGICLLYLVQGQIYSFVGWFIDLFSGLLGF